jgi:uncharacterized protein
MNTGNIIAALILSIGIAVGGYFVGDGLFDFRGSARSVEVRGLSERQVKADIAVWTVRHGANAASLTEAQAQVNRNSDVLRKFFAENGFKEEEVSVGDGSVWEDRRNDGTVFYNVDRAFIIRTKEIDKVQQANQKIYDLVNEGIVIRSATPRYSFTNLNAIKPDMIGEATKNAREAAARFAADSGSDVGAILSANQGLFSISARDAGSNEDEGQFIDKTVRVVTTVNFMIKD